MITHPAYGAEPWLVRETALHLDVLAQSESVFALSNGHIGLRGNLDEGEPHGLPGTYLGSFCELRPLLSAESAYGQPGSSETVVNVTNGKLIRLLVDDEPLDVRYGRLLEHERVLDFREGALYRHALWESPGRRTIALRTTRIVSLTQRAVAAISYEVSATDHPVRVVVQSELVANEELPEPGQSTTSGIVPDPRAAAVLKAPLVGVSQASSALQVLLVHGTRLSGQRMAALMDHEILEIPGDHQERTEVWADKGRVTITALLAPGEKVHVIKYLAYGWSEERSLPALEDQVAGAAYAARHTGFEGLLAAQRAYLDQFWDRADIEVHEDQEVQQAARFALFQILQAGVRAEQRAIPAKGLTGPGYDGHAFWDTETFVLPVLTATAPDAAADALIWRQSTLPQARKRAVQLGRRGAAFPWRTILGEECSGYWPASLAAFHVNADIAHAAVRYLEATGNEDMAPVATELVVETARLWLSLGHFDDDHGFRVDGVTGPDEYSAIADNNIYTNLMAQANLTDAALLAERYPDAAAQLSVSREEVTAWRKAAGQIVVPFDKELGVHQQSEGFTRHQPWDFAATKDDQYPLLLHFSYFDLYRSQVVKQADLVMAMYLRGDAFSAEEKERNFRYYEAITVRDSSLSACIQSIVAAELGYMDLAYDYLREAALMDLEDLEHNTRDGLHMASLAGSWLALVAGLGGMRQSDGKLNFSPRLPARLGRVSFRVVWRGSRLAVAVTASSAVYSSRGPLPGAFSEPITLHHYGEAISLRPGESATRSIPPLAPRDPPGQPRGRAPAHEPPPGGDKPGRGARVRRGTA
ncbi:MAG TPA: glycosyl hydrolase family 65 protein [Acidimicrobiales bacterium]|nr:glycosyl hydrolase family 65 protein [Acidimicrobiales bacterium]